MLPFVHVQMYVKFNTVWMQQLYATASPKSIGYFYAHGRRLCSNWFRHGSTTISYPPQCSLTFMRERYLHKCRE